MSAKTTPRAALIMYNTLETLCEVNAETLKFALYTAVQHVKNKQSKDKHTFIEQYESYCDKFDEECESTLAWMAYSMLYDDIKRGADSYERRSEAARQNINKRWGTESYGEAGRNKANTYMQRNDSLEDCYTDI